jgi:hypothetical protein
MGTGSFPEVKRPRRGVDHPSHLAQRLKKEYSIPLLPFWAFIACSRLNFTFTFTCIPCNRVILEKLTGPQVFKKFPAFYGTRRPITAFTSARYLCLS